MANPPGGPMSGGMEAQQDFARRTIQEKQPVQRDQQPPQESQSAKQQVDPEAAKLKNLAENERVAESRIRENAARFAPKEVSHTSEQQRPPQKQNEQGR